jgi:hypothetical protein
MKNLTLWDLAMGLEQLLDKHTDALNTLQSSTIYAPMLRAKRDEITAVFSRGVPGQTMPLAPELRAADGIHDLSGNGFRAHLESYIQTPRVPADLRNAAQRLHSDLAPTRADLHRAYVDEAQAARPRRAQLPDYADDLRRFPTADGRTLYDWYVDFLDAADHIHALLQARVAAFATDQDLTAVEGSPTASTLRFQTLKLLGRFRKTARDEMVARPDLPRGLETQLFGYFDLLQSARSPS